MSPGGSGYFACIQNMKLVTNKFKSGGLHEKHVLTTSNLRNHLSICLYTQGKQGNPVSRWPVAEPTEYMFIRPPLLVRTPYYPFVKIGRNIFLVCGILPSGCPTTTEYACFTFHAKLVTCSFPWNIPIILGTSLRNTVVKVLCYKSEGRWFDPSWC